MLTVGEIVCIWRQVIHRKSLYILLNFAVNLLFKTYYLKIIKNLLFKNNLSLKNKMCIYYLLHRDNDPSLNSVAPNNKHLFSLWVCLWLFRLGCSPGLMWAAVLGSAGLTHMLWLTGSWLLQAGLDWGNWDNSFLLHGPLLIQQTSLGMFSWWWQWHKSSSRRTQVCFQTSARVMYVIPGATTSYMIEFRIEG